VSTTASRQSWRQNREHRRPSQVARHRRRGRCAHYHSAVHEPLLALPVQHGRLRVPRLLLEWVAVLFLSLHGSRLLVRPQWSRLSRPAKTTTPSGSYIGPCSARWACATCSSTRWCPALADQVRVARGSLPAAHPRGRAHLPPLRARHLAASGRACEGESGADRAHHTPKSRSLQNHMLPQPAAPAADQAAAYAPPAATWVAQGIPMRLKLYVAIFKISALVRINSVMHNMCKLVPFTLMLPSIHFCKWNLLIVLNQNLPIRDKNDYDFCKILLSYSVFTWSTCNQQFIIRNKPLYFFIIEPQVLNKVTINALDTGLCFGKYLHIISIFKDIYDHIISSGN